MLKKIISTSGLILCISTTAMALSHQSPEALEQLKIGVQKMAPLAQVIEPLYKNFQGGGLNPLVFNYNNALDDLSNRMLDSEYRLYDMKTADGGGNITSLDYVIKVNEEQEGFDLTLRERGDWTEEEKLAVCKNLDKGKKIEDLFPLQQSAEAMQIYHWDKDTKSEVCPLRVDARIDSLDASVRKMILGLPEASDIKHKEQPHAIRYKVEGVNGFIGSLSDIKIRAFRTLSIEFKVQDLASGYTVGSALAKDDLGEVQGVGIDDVIRGIILSGAALKSQRLQDIMKPYDIDLNSIDTTEGYYARGGLKTLREKLNKVELGIQQMSDQDKSAFLTYILIDHL